MGATKKEQDAFLKAIAPIAQKYAAQYGLKYPSVCIAQGILESGWGTTELAKNANNYHGLKYKKAVSGDRYYVKPAKEQKADGTYYTDEKTKWCMFDDLDTGVKGYYDFLKSGKHYAPLWEATSAFDYVEKIKAAGYATSLTYVEKIENLITQYDLTKYDPQPIPDPCPAPEVFPEDLPYGTWYRVRKTWADKASQKGAYQHKSNAFKCADRYSGYSVFLDGMLVPRV